MYWEYLRLHIAMLLFKNMVLRTLSSAVTIRNYKGLGIKIFICYMSFLRDIFYLCRNSKFVKLPKINILFDQVPHRWPALSAKRKPSPLFYSAAVLASVPAIPASKVVLSPPTLNAEFARGPWERKSSLSLSKCLESKRMTIWKRSTWETTFSHWKGKWKWEDVSHQCQEMVCISTLLPTTTNDPKVLSTTQNTCLANMESPKAAEWMAGILINPWQAIPVDSPPTMKEIKQTQQFGEVFMIDTCNRMQIILRLEVKIILLFINHPHLQEETHSSLSQVTKAGCSGKDQPQNRLVWADRLQIKI